MSNRRPGRQDDELLKGCWDWAVEAVDEHEAGVRVVMTPTTRKGIWLLRVQACDVVDGKVVCVKAQHTMEFPGSSHQTLAGAIMAGLLTLDHTLHQGDGLQQRPM